MHVLISGAYGNLGQACLLEASHRGWDAVAMARRTGQDLTDWHATERFIYNRAPFDLVIMAHGTHRIVAVDETFKCDYDYIIKNNLEASIALTTALLKSDRLAPDGLLIYCSSIQATHTRAKRALYAAAKAGLEGYARGIAAEIAGCGRTVVLRLGQLEGQMGSIKLQAEDIAQMRKRCYGPWNQPADVARLCFDLYGQPGMTGCVLDIDSGQGCSIW